MKKIVTLLAVLVVFAVFTVGAFADTFDGTMVRPNNADPNLFFHNGKYYMTQTGTSRVAVFGTAQVEDLATLKLTSNISYTAYLNGTVYDPTVTELYGSGATINGTWSPEIHYFSEEQFPGKSGWYMFLGLRKNTGDSSMVRMVVLKSTTDSPKGPYGHPTSGTKNHSQPVLDKNGDIWDEWACGQTILTIPEGKYKGTYTMWVAEEGRGQSGSSGQFFQKIMIAKMTSPWQFAGDPGIVTTPTQSWEYAGASSTHPRVVEGATPVYGKNGEVFITYSGSGYWSDYGIGQLTWNGGDPLKTASWVKLSTSNGNPIFSAVKAKNLRGAGHASFLTDTDGNGFVCYHAYAYDPETETKASSRDAYIEPYYIDYTKWNGVSYGVIKIGLNKNGIPADTASKVTFATDGSYLTSPTITATGGEMVTLTMSESGATGYLIYKSTDNKTFNYLTTVNSTTYTDSAVTLGKTYYYRAYAYREEEISDVSETVSAVAKKHVYAPVITDIYYDSGAIHLDASMPQYYEEVKLYRSTNGVDFTYEDSAWTLDPTSTPIAFSEDYDISTGTYYYYLVGVDEDGNMSDASNVVNMYVIVLDTPVVTSTTERCDGITVNFTCDAESENNIIFRSDDGGDLYRQIAVIDGDVTAYTDTTVEAGNTYYYRVSSSVSQFESDWSSEKKTVAKHNVLNGEAKVATCTEDGYTAYTYCEYCSKVLSGKTSIPATGHVDTETVTVDATCTEAGSITETCKCGVVVSTEEIPATGHVDTETVTVDATCTEAGSITVTCKCGVVVSTEEIPATGHSYEVTEEEIPATTTSVGKTAVYTCSSCGDSYGGEEIPMLEDPNAFTMAGDANRDGALNILDVLRALKASIGGDVSINLLNADMNGNGKIDITDALMILKAVLDE